MKKVVVIVSIVFFVGLFFSSCKTASCPAYGEVHKYQKERGN
jgi:hypothetical protein